MNGPPRRPRPAVAFTVLTDRDTVRLVAGEDFRYTLCGSELELWLPNLLARFDGQNALEDVLAALPEERRDAAMELVDRLYGERVLVDGVGLDVHRPRRYRPTPVGPAAWVAGWDPADANVDSECLSVFCQDTLDYDEALRFNLLCRDAGRPWIWASTGPMSRAYIGPLLLPDAGPCLNCLLRHFRQLSPAPELYEALSLHGRQGRAMTPAPFPVPALAIVRELITWKTALAEEAEPPAALYRLHVLELASLELTSHRVFVDPECSVCGGRN